MKQEIDVFAHSGEVLKALRSGALLMTKSGEQVNAMTIGWGCLGIEWSKPVFIAYVRSSRHSKKLLDENPNFTISVPYGGDCKEILKVCGTKSGRDMDKIAALGLTLEDAQCNGVPGVAELPMTIECKVIYQKQQDPAAIDEEILRKHYGIPADDIHTAYYGEIVAAYLIQE